MIATPGAGDRPERVRPTRLFVTVLGLVTFVAPLSLHLFFPATPSVKAHFGVSDAIAQLTVSAPMFMMAVLTLVYGSLSDRLGRRRVLLSGIFLFCVGGTIAAVSGSVEMLLAGRLIQAAGGACGLALARAIARDVYGPDGLVRVIAYLTMAYSLGPMLAPPIGGYLVDVSGWRSVLIFATLAGLTIAVLVFFTIYETHGVRGKRGAPASGYLADYVRLFRDARFTAFVVQSGACSGAFFAAATGAAFVMTESLDRPASEYGLYFMFFPAGYWLGNYLASRLSGRATIETMVLAGSVVLALTAAGQGAIILSGHLSPLAIFVPGFLITFSQGIGLANAQAGAMRIAGERSGTAAGIGVFMQMLGAGAFSQLFGLLADGTPTPLIVAVSAAAGLALVAGVVPFALSRRPR